MLSRLFRARPLLLAAVLLAFALAPTANAGEAYYLMVFGSQRTPRDPDYSHSFATFVRATWDDCQPNKLALEHHTVSWLPSNRMVRTRALLPEPGTNFDLYTTIEHVLATEQRVSMWGPFQVEPRVYYAALEKIAELNSGKVRYKAVDSFRNSDRVSNCIHAISSIDNGDRVRVLSPGWGDTASYMLMINFRDYMLDSGEVHYWVSSALGLDCYPIVYRESPTRRRVPVTGLLIPDRRNPTPSFGPPRP